MIRKAHWLILLLVFHGWAEPALAEKGELMVGFGYGGQIHAPPQNNAVIDLLYDFCSYNRGNWQLSGGVGISWLWDDFDHDEVLVGSVYPSLRYYLGETERFKYYAFITTGFSYMTEPGLGQQVLGGNFAFNDSVGVGTYVGRERLWSVAFCWRHLSNAGLYTPNEGIDIPFCLLVGRRL